MIKTGTRIELNGTPSLGVPPEMATIAKWGKKSGPRENMLGWHIVKFNDGGSLMVHESRFRIIDNRG